MRRLGLPLVLTILVAFPAGASAAFDDGRGPRTVPSGIVVNKQIGAMRFSMTFSQMLKAWGVEGSDCDIGDKAPDAQCFWGSRNGTTMLGFGSVRFRNGKIDSIAIIAPKGREKKAGAIREFTLNPGLRIGSTRTQVRNGFRQFPPSGKLTIGKKPNRDGSFTDSVLSKDKKFSTSFIYNKGLLQAISMYRQAPAR